MTVKVSKPQVDLREEINKALTLQGISNQTITVQNLVSKGNIGISGKPNDWAPTRNVLQIEQGSLSTINDDATILGSNFYVDSAGNSRYISDLTYGAAYITLLAADSAISFARAPSGAAGDVATFTESMRIMDDGKVGINNDSPVAKLDIYNDQDHADLYLTNDGYDCSITMFSYRDVSNHNTILGFASRGTKASPASLQDNDSMLRILGRGYNTSDGTYNPSVEIAFTVDGEPNTASDPSDMPGRIEFKTAADGTDSENIRMVIKNDGKVGIGQNTPAETLHVGNANANFIRVHNAGSGDVSSGFSITRNNDVGLQIYDNPQDDTTTFNAAGNMNFRKHAVGTRLYISTDGNVVVGNRADAVGQTNSNLDSAELLRIVGPAWSDATNNQPGLSLAGTNSRPTSAAIYFNEEKDSSAKAIYQESYYMVIRGHNNEGIKFKGNGNPANTTYQFNGTNNGSSCFNASNSANWNTTSDARIKENIQALPDGSLSKINALRPVTFDYSDEWADKMAWWKFDENGNKADFNPERKNNEIGWIAQEYETVFPEDVITSAETVGENTYEDFRTLKPDSVVPHLVKAVQELSAQVEALQAEVQALKGQ